ncbi:MAG: glycoside hydrolase family 15 protein [bacterium]|nr:glycoside hydrolase family 15 protein [bacterium]
MPIQTGVDLRQISLNVIRDGQAESGAYVASPTFSQYGYSWLRDGAWIAHAMDTVGDHESARAFHRWAGRTLLHYEAQIETLLATLERGETPAEADYLPTRFTLDGGLGRDAWTDFQLDGYGAWLWVLVQHCQHITPALWAEVRPAVALLVRYLAALWASPNYDCWEEFRDHVHTATLAALYGGLRAVQSHDPALVPADLPATIRDYALAHGLHPDGGLSKFIPPDAASGKAVDASLLWVAVPFGLVAVDDPIFQKTLAHIERDLHVPGGGVYRYRDDTYFGGGEWLLLAAWLGWAYVELGRLDEARHLRNWIEAQATPDGELPEQVDHHLLDSSTYQGWVEKWGESACPLLWSHAMYLILDDAINSASGKT